jgi:hypothetical protein
MRYSDDHIALFAPGFDVAVGVGGLFQRVARVDDRTDRAGLEQLVEE